MPTTAYDVKGMLIKAMEIDDPIIFLEHRWLYQIKGDVPENGYSENIDSAKICKRGKDVTLVGISYMTVECIKAARYLKKHNVSAEVIDLRSIRPLDAKTVAKSVRKTRNLIIVDNGHVEYGVSAELFVPGIGYQQGY